MELVYLWVEDYKNIHKQGFNFSPRFSCDYDEKTKELTINENDDYIENFFGENINVTAIVGKNGSGKSSVLECLHSIINDIEHRNFNYILVYRIDEINYTSNIPINSDITKKDIRRVQCHIYSNDIKEYKNNISIRKESVLKNLISNSLQNDFELTTFMYIPTSITIIKVHINDEFYKLLDFTPTNINYDDTLDYDENKRLTDALIENLAYLKANISTDYHKFLIILFILEKEYDELYDLENIDRLKEKLKESDINYLEQEEFDRYFSTDDELKPIERLIERDKEIYLKYSYLFTFDFIDSKNRGYNNLSHGERTIFGQFLSIYYLSIKQYGSNYLFLLDEAELSLHPNWQKNYINELINLLKQIDKTFHFILTSHSPFLLSDLPKQNTIFLDTYEDKDNKSKEKYPNLNLENLENGNCLNVSSEIDIKPFGANIHELLSHGFFMEDGLMGEFAKNKIQEIMDFLNDKKSIDEISTKEGNIKKIIEAIGEPFLKDKLLYMYDEKYPQTDEEKIQDLEAEIERIKSGQN